MSNFDEDISRALSVLRSSPDLCDEEIYKTLLKNGLEPKGAARLIEFLPIIYARVVLRDLGVRFEDRILRRRSDGTFREVALDSDVIWNAAVAFAKEELKRGVSRNELLAVAARSAEFDAANKLLNNGSKPENVVLAPLVLTRPE